MRTQQRWPNIVLKKLQTKNMLVVIWGFVHQSLFRTDRPSGIWLQLGICSPDPLPDRLPVGDSVQPYCQVGHAVEHEAWTKYN